VKTDVRVNQTGPVRVVFQMATAYWASQDIYVAAKLGVADVLGEGSKSRDEIASATGANSKSLARLTRALVALGVLAVDDDGRFRLTGIVASLPEWYAAFHALHNSDTRRGALSGLGKTDRQH
jgi:Dimerisation domain